MKLLKVAAAVMNQTPLDWEGNRAHILAAIEEARASGATLLCLPELCITGYGCEDAFHAAGLVVSFGLPLFHHNALYNTACLAVDGRIAGFCAKQFLAGDGIHYEPRWFKPWPAGQRAEVTIGGQRYPLGALYFEVGGVKIGFEICEDAWVAKRPGAELSRRGVDVILNPSASHFAFGKHEVRKRFVLEGSRAFGVTYVYANLLGNESGRAIFDGGGLIASGGKLVAEGPRFSFRDQLLSCAVVDLEATRTSQARTGSFSPEATEAPGEMIAVPFEWPEREPEEARSVRDAWDGGPRTKDEELTRAIALGLYDYLRKSRSEGFVISLSGGADSAACACLVSLSVELGFAEIGREAWLAKVAYARRLAEPDPGSTAAAALVSRLLVCVYQATRNSSAVTRDAARTVARSLGAEFLELDIDPLVAGYTSLVERAIGRPLGWKTDDIALQNIQARVRSPSVWLLANLRNSLLLATSNRSEAAVGYATMDGDTSGGLSPIAGIDKAYLRTWLRWLEAEGPHGMHPFPALSAVNAQQPTAELRPQENHQTDEDDLMPYDLLDAIEKSAVRDKRMPVEVYREMRAKFSRIEPTQLGVWVERFFRLFCRNQWKRERYAPSFHLDDENLDPKTWCRFPILSSGFQRELEALRVYVEAHAKSSQGGTP